MDSLGRTGYLSVGFNQQLEGIKTEQKNGRTMESIGCSITCNSQLNDAMSVWLIIPDDDLHRSYLVTQNFRTIMHWNSSYFLPLALSQWLMALLIK